MAKRSAPIDSDSDLDSFQNLNASTSSKSKRVRTSDVDQKPSLVARVKSDSRRIATDKGKAREDDEDSGLDTDDDIDDEDLKIKNDGRGEDEDEEYEEQIRASIEARRRTQGGIAEHGIIEAIEMHQFMCHKYLSFTFGPQINFIIGHNGSGKSAVLSAITVALGGKATSTGRGSGLKYFIREGQSLAEVTITIKNQGEEAYRPAEYGKSIIITRRFTKDGSSSWKIKAKDGRAISTKKEELQAICDHMNIQVDNPLNVLTQDAARQFLAASHPGDKYKLFLKGTQLTQLSTEYEICLENIRTTGRIIQQKKEAVPDLKREFNEARARYEEAARAREQKKKADELKKELAWAHVATKEAEYRKVAEEVAKMKRRLPKIQQEVDTAEAKVQECTEEVARYEAEYRELGNIPHLDAKRKELQEKLRANKVKMNSLKTDEKDMDTSIKSLNKQISEYTKLIAEEAKRNETSSRTKRSETQQALEEAREACDSTQKHLDSLLQQKREVEDQVKDYKNRGEAAKIHMDGIKGRITECEGMIDKCRQQEGDSMSAFGRNIEGVRRKVDKMAAQGQWKGDVPLGPLGVGVKVRKGSEWASGVLRSQLGQYLTAWAVTQAKDQPVLKKLLRDAGNPNTSIFIIEKDLFEYSSGEPPEGVLTVLRAIEIPNPYALRIMINQARIERTLLARDRPEAQQKLTALKGGTAWTANGLRVNVFTEGGGQTQPLQFLRSGDPMNLLLTGRDAAGEMQHYKDELAKHEEEYKAATRELKQLRSKYTEENRIFDNLTSQERAAVTAQRKAKLTVENLEKAATEELPANIQSFEGARADAESEKENVIQQFKGLQQQKAALDEEQKPLNAQLTDIKKQIDAFEERRSALRTQIENVAAERLKAQNGKNHFVSKYDTEKTKVTTAEENEKVLEAEFTNWTASAQQYCDRVENPRKVDEVQKALDGVQKALKEREKRHGASVEEMTIQVNKAKLKLDAVEKDLKSMSILNKTLKHSLLVRLAKWQEFRRHIALRCKVVFQYHMSHRGYFGKVLFDHEHTTLQLKVQTDDQTGTQAREKDPRSLSGGEKSFSTICLLLSLWESIECPLRCLDEFDVFMDAVNRRISMRMMIDTANHSDKKQYILITPQDMGNVQIGPTVRVHRMTDPERGQGRLAFVG